MSQLARWRRTRWTWLVLCGAVVGGGVCQCAAAPPTQSAAVFDSYVGRDGKAVFALKLTPQVAQPANQPHDVVVLFDTSASQIGAYRDKALGVVRAMLSGLSADDRVALIAVDVRAVRLTDSLVPPRDSSMTHAISALQRRVPLGSTDMPAALDAAMAAWPAKRDPARARSVLYIGDGFSIASLVPLATLKRLEDQYTDRRISFNSYAIGPRVNAELLGALSNHTGGMLVPDVEGASDRQVGNYLAAIARGTVVWPTKSVFPAAIQKIYPHKTPPLRFDRDSVLLGTFDEQSLKVGEALKIEVQGELGGRPITLSWQPKAPQPAGENAYLAKVVEWAAMTDGVTLPTAGSATLSDMRRWATFGAQQLARLGEKALAVGRADEAVQLAGEAERLDPVNTEAEQVRGAATRARQASAADLRMAREPARPAGETAVAADGDVLDEIEHQQRVVQGFLWAEVTEALDRANAAMSTDPDGARDQLKFLLEKVQHTAEVEPEARTQMVSRIESGLRAASHMSVNKTEHDLLQQQANAASDAKERINRALLLDEQKVDQLMSRFNALMAEERYREAEALADIAEEIQPSTPTLRNAELTARTVGHTAEILAVRDMRHKGGVDMLYQVELSNIPSADDPPIIYPDPTVWQLLSERRKKFKSIDLTEPK
ncbi:MAG: hypothetical protein ACREHD_11640, partial [Pirellulales bacterium]